MLIANPIYDVVFKYLMEDSEVAKIFLSAVTGLEIVHLELIPQELVVDKSPPQKDKFLIALNLSVYRLVFSAKVREADSSEKMVLIELQKSKFTHIQMPFREYQSQQETNYRLFRWIEESTGREYSPGIPILPIYILGERLYGFEHIPVITVDNCIRDNFSKEILAEANQFTKALFHQGVLINIPAIHQGRRNELEKLLSIFDQNNRFGNPHILSVKETDFPQKYMPIIRRLQAASLTEEVLHMMNIEDELLVTFNEFEHQISEEIRQKEHIKRVNY